MNSQNQDVYMNGRVHILGNKAMDQFSLFDKPAENLNSKGTTSYTEAMTGNWKDSMLSKAYFSAENFQLVQNNIRRKVFECSKGLYTIGPQDDTNLKIIMRSIFLQNAKNNPTNITGQIAELNEHVYEYCVPSIVSEAKAYLKYKSDASTLAVPEARPVHVSVKGDKVLELKHFF